jgi:ribonuclease Z
VSNFSLEKSRGSLTSSGLGDIRYTVAADASIDEPSREPGLPGMFAFLGTSGALPSAERDTTSIVFATAETALLVDCGGSPGQRLARVGVDPLRLSHVVITHVHADHAYGLPALVQTLTLLERRAPLSVVCRPEHVDTLRTLLDTLGVARPGGLYTVEFSPISLEPGALAFAAGALRVTTAPNDHGSMPNFAVRVDGGARGAVVYSSDTAPCEAVIELARGAHTLIHEATFPHRHRGRFGAHSTAAEAGDVAARAGVARLLLTHIDARYHGELEGLAAEARARFGGEVDVARELAPYPL